MAELEAQIRQLNPRTAIVRTERGEMDYAQIVYRQTDKHAGPVSSSRQAPVHDHFHTLTCLCEAPLVRERFERLMRSLPDTVWRAKGFVRFTDSDEQWDVSICDRRIRHGVAGFITRAARARRFYR